jgi:hypothetical protein
MLLRGTVDHPIPVSIASAQAGPRTAARIRRRKGWPCLLTLVPLMLTVGCATVTRQTVPKKLVSEATVLDMPDMRAWDDESNTVLYSAA